jgi:hypothetical protein
MPGVGWLTVSCSPECESVSEGGTSLGAMPFVRRPMAAGEHQLVLTHGTLWRIITVTITEGKESRAFVDWPSFGAPATFATPEPAPKVRYSTRLMVIGIVSLSAGGVALIGAGALAMAQFTSWCSTPTSTSWYSEGPAAPSSPASCQRDYGPAIGLAIGGALGILLGIPLLATGARKIPAGSSVASASSLPVWVGAPAGRGWRWQF